MQTELTNKIKSKEWFKNSDPEIQEKLLNLPSDFSGFLSDLSDRDSSLGNLIIISLQDIQFGKYLALPVFKVKSKLTGELYTYEFVSWKYGRNTGFKGVILLQKGGEIKYLIISKSLKFPLGKEILEAIGTFYINFEEKSTIGLRKSIEKTLSKLLKTNKIKFDKFVDLGMLHNASGLTNQEVNLFAGIINIDKHEVNEEDLVYLDKYIPGSELTIVRLVDLPNMIDKITDANLLSCITKLKNIHLIP